MKKIASISFLSLMVIGLVQIMPAPIQNEVEAFRASGDCSIEMGSRRGWFGVCRGSTDNFCKMKGDCKIVIKL